MLFSRAQAPLVAPLDSVCLRRALEARVGPAVLTPHLVRGTRRAAPVLWLYYGDATYAQTFPRTGTATLTGSQVVEAGYKAIFPGKGSRARQDSVAHVLGERVLALRDECGGHTPEGNSAVSYLQ